MPKLRVPLLSFDAKRSFGKLLSITHRHGKPILEKKPVPTDAQSSPQLYWRHMFTKCVDLWHTLSAAEQQEWESAARSKHMTGYAWYISQCLRPNPGIYLPLQGGTMSGDIDMHANRILTLNDPADLKEPATKGYHDANKYTDGEADARIALHAAVSAAHHAKTVLFATLTDRWTLAQAHRGTLDRIMVFQGPGADPIEEDKGATLTIAETEAYSGDTPPVAWTDLDLSGIVGANSALVKLKVSYTDPDAGQSTYAFRRNGDTDEAYKVSQSIGCTLLDIIRLVFSTAWVETDSSGIIEWKAEAARIGTTVDVVSYIK